MKIPKLSEVEEYVKEKNLHVDPQFFIDYFTASGWIDSRGNPVKVWKLKCLTWDRAKRERGKTHKCYCGKPGVYINGQDDTGQAVWRCIDHKPINKSFVSEQQAEKILKVVKFDDRSVSDKVNEQRRKLNNAVY